MDLSALAGGVAVLTGSASGLGFAMAKECLARGMHVVISDVREESLSKAVHELAQASKNSLKIEGFVCDVTSLPSVEALLASVKGAFPSLPIQFVAANAGVLYKGSTVLTGTAQEWENTYRVNVLGLAYTLRTFIPALISQRQKALVEITASSAGLIFGSLGPYGTSKLASVGVAEALYQELALHPDNPLRHISMVVLCPVFVKTELLESAGLGDKGARRKQDSASTAGAFFLDHVWGYGMQPTFCAAQVFEHAAEGKFYCILDNIMERDGIGSRMEDAMADRLNAMRSRNLQDNLKDRFQYPLQSQRVPSKL